ncbi:MAG: SRPBCC family protein, partial [Myxococcota bacterium]
MARETIRLSAIIPATPQRIYDAWLDGEQHSAFTGASAEVDPEVGGRFTAWDGYIEGKTLEKEANRRIVQSWRTSEFPPEAEDSRVTVELDEVIGGTRVTLIHEDIPEGDSNKYEEGWKDFYFKPMKKYFGEAAEAEETAKTPVVREAKPAAAEERTLVTGRPEAAAPAPKKKAPAKKKAAKKKAPA